MSTIDLDLLKNAVRAAGPVTTDEVRVIVENFFKDIKWSLTKDEWENHMDDSQREALYSKLLVDAVNETTSRHRTLRLDDIDSFG